MKNHPDDVLYIWFHLKVQPWFIACCKDPGSDTIIVYTKTKVLERNIEFKPNIVFQEFQEIDRQTVLELWKGIPDDYEAFTEKDRIELQLESIE